jgi:hypothetical protein
VTPPILLSLAERMNLTEKLKEDESKPDIEMDQFLKEVNRFDIKYQHLQLKTTIVKNQTNTTLVEDEEVIVHR